MDLGLLEYIVLFSSLIALCATVYRNSKEVKRKRERDEYYRKLNNPPSKGDRGKRSDW